jgi:hypothetical protein
MHLQSPTPVFPGLDRDSPDHPTFPGGVPPLARASRALIAAGSQQLRLNNYSGSI